MDKVMRLIEGATNGRSYSSHKFSLDENKPGIDYGEDHKNIVWKKYGEKTHGTTYINLTQDAKKLAKTNDQILSYFLDGSRKVDKVGDIAFEHSGNRSVLYPVIGGQIGVGCCVRRNKRLSCEKYNDTANGKPEIVISLPDIANADGKAGFFPAMAQKLSGSEICTRMKIQFSAILPYNTSRVKDSKEDKKFEDRGIAQIQQRMYEREQELVSELVKEGKLNQNNYLVKDGSLEYRPLPEYKKDVKKQKIFKNNYNWVLGVSKQFNPEICLDSNGKINPGFIADLPLYHRTPVAKYENEDKEYYGDTQYAVWYIRLHGKDRTRSPFDGILKIEKMLVTNEEITEGIETSLVNRLSAELINERNPVCYGADKRWANHIYPVYLTESFIKSKYLSEESFLHLF
jgi:hypothetical protein